MRLLVILLLLVLTGCASQPRGFWIERWSDYARCFNNEQMHPTALYDHGLLKERCVPR